MFTANLAEFKTTQNELHKQAEHYRLVKSLEKRTSLSSRLANALGQMLLNSGQQLLSLATR